MAVGELAAWLAAVLSVVSFVLVMLGARRLGRLERRFKSLAVGAGPGAEAMSLAQLVSSQASRVDNMYAEAARLGRAVETLEQKADGAMQCVGLVRYNPFEDTGGDQSFALALLDGRGDGVVISSLHGRTATRFYAKPVKAGTSTLSLSDEEVRALKQAREKPAAKQ